MPSNDPVTPKPKDKRTEIKLPAELHERATKKADSRGWTLSSVLRALLELWVDEDVVDPKDVGKSAKRAPKSKKKNSS